MCDAGTEEDDPDRAKWTGNTFLRDQLLAAAASQPHAGSGGTAIAFVEGVESPKACASECLKNKKHWNSFATDFLVPPARWIADLEETGAVVSGSRAAQAEQEAKLKREMRCPQSFFRAA